MIRHRAKVAARLLELLIFAGLAQTACYANDHACKQKTFGGTVDGGEAFTQPIGSNLEIDLEPLSEKEGWEISVRPHSFAEDWSYPVNLPLSGESQSLGTGWGMTARDRLSAPHELRFVLSKVDFEHYSQMADEALHSSDMDVTNRFIKRVGDATGRILFIPLKFKDNGSPETVKWLRFIVRVTVPKSFHTDGKGWRVVSCPAPDEMP